MSEENRNYVDNDAMDAAAGGGNREPMEEITIKFAKGLVGEPFMSKSGTELVRISIPNSDPKDHSPWQEFVLASKQVHENRYGREIAGCIPNIDFIMKGAIESYSDGQIDFFEVQVKNKKIYSKHSGYVEPLQSDEFEDYDEFIEEYPDLEDPLTEEDFEEFAETEDGIMYITQGGFGAVVSEEQLPVIIDEMDL